MNEDKKIITENEESEDQVESSVVENIEAVGQIILGEVEKIGGILMADPIAQAEGEYNIEIGKLHRDLNEDMAEAEADRLNEDDKV